MRFLRWLMVTVLVLAILGGALAGGGFFLAREYARSPGPEAVSGETIVLLERGLGVKAIARRLEEAGVIANADFFSLWVRINGQMTALKAGEYAIPSGASVEDIIDILVEGKSIMHRLTIAEGLTSAQAMRLVAADPVLTGEMPAVPAEGALLPETYLFLRGTTREAIVADMTAAHDALIEELWPNRQAGLPFDTPYEAVILASIVEKETALPEERPRIASVFVNRLRRGMRLQSDPTIIYGLTKGEPLGRGLRRSELDKATAYNTYLIDGLPPTPIANPGRASIEAVLNPPETDDLYFVADGSGGHVFAETYADHQRNVLRWRQVEREQQNGE